jgi:hypothetical protein
MSEDHTGHRFRPASLDALNFLLSDVRGALGPYLNVFLVTRQHWSQTEVGLVTAVGGWLGRLPSEGRSTPRGTNAVPSSVVDQGPL